jgi:Zn finger protein HypA/HybF involved in hydrogenase expression
MHELSIAIAILELAGRRVPADCALASVRVAAGPMRGIDADALQLAWQVVVADAGMPPVRLELDARPWTLACAACGRQWNIDSLDDVCTCGSARVAPVGGDELDLLSIEVSEIVAGKESRHARVGRGKRLEAQRRGRGAEPPAVQGGRRVRGGRHGRAGEWQDGAN